MRKSFDDTVVADLRIEDVSAGSIHALMVGAVYRKCTTIKTAKKGPVGSGRLMYLVMVIILMAFISGKMLKDIGTKAREDIENFLETKVFLEICMIAQNRNSKTVSFDNKKMWMWILSAPDCRKT